MMDFLKSIKLFADFPSDELDEICKICEPVLFQAGQQIFYEGQEGDSMLIIEDGGVKIYRRLPSGDSVTLDTLAPGEVLGELALIDGAPRTAAASAMTVVKAYLLLREGYLRLRDARSPAAFRLTRKISIITAMRIRNINEVIMKEVSKASGWEIDESETAPAPAPASAPQPVGSNLLTKLFRRGQNG